MVAKKTVWGIDIGNCALKALKLSSVDDQLKVEAFDIVEHGEILSQPNVNRHQVIHNALEQFLARNSVAGSTVVISVPGQTSFNRFVKLPPVEPKKIPEIVRFEAEQQIPCAIEEVIWRWQTFHDPDSPDVEVGLFAMKRVDVAQMLEHFDEVGLNVDIVQMAPLALYSFMTCDAQVATDGATLLVDVGADKTDLVVSDGARIWTRTILLGGNNFTEALVRAFKLSFAKAEKLKRTAATSKYARQIFQAMRPVFADIVQEIQKSIGWYTSVHRETRFKRLIGLGNGFRLPGLQKFLEQSLNIPVVRLDSYNILRPPETNAPAFTENALSFAVAYGLALQGLGKAAVETNLLPTEVARRRAWSAKRPWWVAAAAMVLLTLGTMVFRSFSDKSVLQTGAERFAQAGRIAENLGELRKDYNMLSNQGDMEIDQVKSYLELFKYRDFWPSVETLISESIVSVAADQGVLEAYGRATGDNDADKAARKSILGKLQERPRNQWAYIVVEEITSAYKSDLATPAEALLTHGRAASASAGPADSAGGRGFWVVLTGRTPLDRTKANRMLAQLLASSVQIGSTMSALDVHSYAFDFVEASPTMAAPVPAGPRGTTARNVASDPLLPDSDTSKDTRFQIGWLIKIVDDGIEVPLPQSAPPGE